MKTMLIHEEGELLQTAVLHNGRIVDFFMERSETGGLVGNIYKGRVVNVLPGMQAAFVDIGLNKNAFLYIDELLQPTDEKRQRDKPSITELVRPGQELLVQVIKEPLGSKGARVTSHYSLPGRWLVYMPNADYVGVSKKIESESERNRLRGVGESLRQRGEGIIMRTLAKGESEESLRSDLMQLRQTWENVRLRFKAAKPPEPVLLEAGLLRRIFRDMLSSDIDEVWVDDPALFEEAASMIRELAPAMEGRLRLYPAHGSVSLFEKYGIAEQLNAAFQTRVWLPSGGYLIWEQTEALTVIDVNTGKFTGTSGLEDTVYRTNLEAADEIARLLRLRDVGGIVIADFIDMEASTHREAVRQRLEESAGGDRTKCQIHGWTRLGLLEITRKKTRENVGLQFYQLCETCGGSGRRYVGLPKARRGADAGGHRPQ
ncbi:Rne/Rng family ribonuclease [Paenibacillus beijingensis]|uniref:Ribonuclease n=1 Tax=Paenibacillus beijingensis TaxID=1126833 RepID=A0A0D5NM40_9BACL|nr:Rne/Rng family ribonuclease [Paenibacillus beijingensis]AJY76067.1 ribonuclease [Paenibacillus beijingensis]